MKKIAKPIAKKPLSKVVIESEKHDLKPQPKGEGVKLIGAPDAFINLLIRDKAERKNVINEIDNEGPKHKQIMNALLAQRLLKLIKTIETFHHTKFALQEGFEMKTNRAGENHVLPITLPIHLEGKFDKNSIAESIEHAPEHEALAYAMNLQVIEWAIKTMTVK